MKTEKIYSTNNYLSSRQLNLFDFGLKPSENNNLLNSINSDFTGNQLLDFVITCYNYAQMIIPKYSHEYSKHKYTQPQLFAILSYKIYNKYNYRRLIDNLNVSDTIKKVIGLKTIPHYTTIQKFFKKLKTEYLNAINDLLLTFFPVTNCYFSLDGTGYTSSYSDIYYNNRMKKPRKSYMKNHIVVDSEYMLIRHQNVKKGPRFDTVFAISAIRSIEKYKPRYILADKAYDTEDIKQTIIEETTAIPQIPTKKNQKTGTYRTKCRAIFWKNIYNFRNQVECVNSIEKRLFSGINTSRSVNLQIKETKLKNTYYNIDRSIKILKR